MIPGNRELRNKLMECKKVYYANEILTKYEKSNIKNDQAWIYLFNRMLAIQAAGYQKLVPIGKKEKCSGCDEFYEVDDVVDEMATRAKTGVISILDRLINHDVAVYFCKE